MAKPPNTSSTSSSSPPVPSFSNLPLTPQNIRLAHSLISPYIHRTPLLTCQTLTTLASHPSLRSHPAGDVIAGAAKPKLNLFFKCENYQKIGAFKARGAYHAVLRLIERDGLEEVRKRGVVSHSSGNHAQALALASSTFKIPAYIVMPSISTPSKIAATRALTRNVIFSGSTSQEREEKVHEVMARTGAVLVPPYDHADVVLGQGTVGVEMEGQFAGRREGQVCAVRLHGLDGGGVAGDASDGGGTGFVRPKNQFDVIVAPCGGGGLLSGIASYFYHDGDGDDGDEDEDEEKKNANADSDAASASASAFAPERTSQNDHSFQAMTTKKRRRRRRKRMRTPYIIGAEPSFQDADDARRSLAAHPPARIPHVKSLTIADGLRTPLGPNVTWPVISHGHEVDDSERGRAWKGDGGVGSDREGGTAGERVKRKIKKVEAIYSVTEDEIKESMRLLFERAKWVVEPSGAVSLAVVLFNQEFRGWVEREQGKEAEAEAEMGGEGCGIRPWNVGVVISGGNTTLEAVAGLFGPGLGDGGVIGTKEKGEAGNNDKKGKEDVRGGFERERHEGKITMDGEKTVEDVAG